MDTASGDRDYLRNFEVLVGSAFADNIGNSRGVTSGTLLSGPLQQFVIRPFTVGLTADFRM